MIMLKGQNKFFHKSKAHYTKCGINNSNLVKEFEKKKFADLAKMIREDWSDTEFKKIDEKNFQA